MARRLLLVVPLGCAIALGGPACVHPQAEGPAPPAPPPAGPPPPPETSSSRDQGPPVPPPAPPPDQPQAPVATSGAPSGQWVYTQEYGWVWLPHGDAYEYIPPNGIGEPLEYAYYPTYGWTWIAAPWVWGIGPWPDFGPRGPAHFAWYTRGYWRSPSRWRYRPVPERSGLAAHGIRPDPRYASRRPAMGARGGEHHGGAVREQGEGHGGGHEGGGRR